MTGSLRDILFIAANAAVGLLIGFAERQGLINAGSAVPPMMLIILGMAAIEAIPGVIMRIPLGSFVGMPIRFAALIVSFAGYMLMLKV